MECDCRIPERTIMHSDTTKYVSNGLFFYLIFFMFSNCHLSFYCASFSLLVIQVAKGYPNQMNGIKHWCCLKQHISHHTGEKVLKCYICEVEYSLNICLTYNITKQLCTCIICDSKACIYTNLVTHMLIHPGKLSYQSLYTGQILIK